MSGQKFAAWLGSSRDVCQPVATAPPAAVIPPTANHEVPLAGINLDIVTGEPLHSKPEVVLLNAHGVGGSNCSIILKRWPTRPSILEHFISINERLSRPVLAYELMLDGFLQLADSESGALILANDTNRGAFRTAVSREFDFDQPHEISLPADTVLQMMTGDMLFVPDGFAGLSSRGWLVGSEFCIGLPLVAGKQL